MDYEKEMVGTVEVPENDRLDEAKLTEWMSANVAGFCRPGGNDQVQRRSV